MGQGKLVLELREELARGNVLVVVGAGVSIQATNGAACASWDGLIRDGVEHAVGIGLLTETDAEDLHVRLKSNSIAARIGVAEKVSEVLGAPDGGEFRRWLCESVGRLEIRDRSLLDAIHALGAPIATTNYDDLLTRGRGIAHVPWTDVSASQEILRGERNAVLHVYGCFDHPESVVLGEGVRAQQTIAANYALLFIGCGDAVCNSIVAAFGKAASRHYRLCRTQEQKPPDGPLFYVAYGDDHTALEPFLRGLVARQPAPAVPGPDSRGRPQIFVSYAREDKVFARRLAKSLQDEGVNVWLDVLSLKPGKHWDKAVEAALRESGEVLVILSPDAVNSDSVMDECSFALDAGKRVIPLMYRRCDVPLRFHRLERIDFSLDYDDALTRLLATLRDQTSPPAEPPVAPPIPVPTAPAVSPAVPDRMRIALITSVLLALAAIAVTLLLTKGDLLNRRKQTTTTASPATDTATTSSTTTAQDTTTETATTTTTRPSGKTPDFTARQGYLDAAPIGVDARHAWTVAGGDGAGVRIMIITGASSYAHEDLGSATLLGELSDDSTWRNHAVGTHGIIAGKNNGFGVTGIAPAATISFNSVLGERSSAEAIMDSVQRLRGGDILLIQIGRGMLPPEWWPDDFAAIRSAVKRGIIVVEVAGNGSLSFDDPDLDRPEKGFPSEWKNPFSGSAASDSGAIIVGAGLRDRSPADFSNFGSRVDVQGWGDAVVTTGYGDLFGNSPTQMYTAEFKGTSAAAAIVAGVIASVQGVVRANGFAPLTPAEMRRLLRDTGSPQTPPAGSPQAKTRRIGSLPDLRELIPAALKLRG